MENYSEKRKRFYSNIKNFWPDLYGEEYALYDAASIGQEEAEMIRIATRKAGHIFFKVCEVLRNADNQTLIEMGFPAETLDFLRIKAMKPESVIARLDLIKSKNTYKCIEINSDTPTFIKELFYVNRMVAADFGLGDPNAGMESHLALSIRKSIADTADWLGEIEPYVVYTAHDDNIEDKNTVLYLRELYGLPSRFVPLHLLRIEPGVGLFDEKGRKVDILYRQTFPIESMILDENGAGNKIGLWLLQLVRDKKLALLNPPSAFLLQNKAVQAVIWGLHENGDPFFSEEEHSWIERYFLPTYLEPVPFIKKKIQYVKKPVFGREGDTVQIFGSDGKLLIEEVHKTYTDVPSIYQECVQLPRAVYLSEKGKQEGHILTGSFLVNGMPSAFGFRAGGEITNNLSCFLPVGLSKERGG
ncbi:glutathionylspermidine synthase family protein [Mesobacillus subterraneus]|uniref:Glutathionylspermidine synthase family protein n=1 Tax=Mesobacillus subterraneus TaxID=285983 RepID=A0A427TM85_9BACI|nr:glutathionylspermidine synthase family protein [Mesobacillus subterraneus]RSD25470.1 glutathionylspermidine synthase family protein [Mesobacillus subterraneus]